MLTLQPVIAYANPQGGVVSAGSATINSNGNELDINQSTGSAVIDWRSFNIAKGELTKITQPSASAIQLDRVNDIYASQIFGTLTANGRVVLINPNGVFFGQGSQINVASLTASTANISNSAFMAGGKLQFNQAGNPDAAIINEGTITAQEAGLVGFVAPRVENDGVITAQLGRIQLASGDTFTLDMAGDKLISVAVSDDVKQQIVSNTGLLKADGGKIALTAAAGRSVVDSLITNSGVIEANSFQQQNGKIILYAEGSNAVKGNVAANKGQKSGSSTVLNSGTLDASGYGTGQTGGSISVLGDHVGILSGAIIDASGDAGGGTIKIGGDFHGAGTTPTAEATVVQSGATITADAITTGNGGNVAVWADNYTNFAGNIEARGGAQSGNGGFVETSGKQILTAVGNVDASAANGNGGTWLLDPNNIIIQAAGSDTNVTGNPSFTTTNDSAIVTTGSIQADLNAGTSVTITTSSGGSNSQLGDIEVASNISKTGGNSANFTLNAADNITIDNGVSISSSSNPAQRHPQRQHRQHRRHHYEQRFIDQHQRRHPDP